MPNRFSTAALAVDPELAPGARNAIRDCLRLQPNERITIITDEATRDIATALQQQVEEVGSDYAVFVLEEYADRPLTNMPREILDDLATSQVSIFCAQTQRGELGSRMEMSAVVNKNRIRHGHMVNISRQIMREGMRADFMAIDALSQRLVERVRRAKRVTCRTPRGTDFVGRSFAEPEMAQNERHHHAREMGQPARGRDFHFARRTATASLSLTAWSAIIFARSMATFRRRP